MKKRYFINIDVLMDFLVYDKYVRAREEDGKKEELVKESCANLTKILKEIDSVCVVSSYSLSILLGYFLSLKSSLGSEITRLFLSFYADKEKWEVVEEDEDIIKKSLDYCKDKSINYKNILQYFCALESCCEVIVTNDESFPNLDILVVNTY